MLPKQEKRPKAVQQLNMVSPLDKAKKLKQKRRIIGVTLFLTTGLCLGFSIYQYLVKYKIKWQLPKINLKISRVRDVKSELDTAVEQLTANDKGVWSIYVQSGDWVWSRNADSLTGNEKLESVAASKSSWIEATLPKGVEVKEIIEEGSGEIRAFYQMTIPGRQILVLFKVLGGNYAESARALIPKLTEKIYWTIVRLST